MDENWREVKEHEYNEYSFKTQCISSWCVDISALRKPSLLSAKHKPMIIVLDFALQSTAIRFVWQPWLSGDGNTLVDSTHMCVAPLLGITIDKENVSTNPNRNHHIKACADLTYRPLTLFACSYFCTQQQRRACDSMFDHIDADRKWIECISGAVLTCCCDAVELCWCCVTHSLSHTPQSHSITHSMSYLCENSLHSLTLTDSLTHWLTHSLTHSLIHSLIHSLRLIHSFIHSLTQSLTHSLNDTLTHSFAHSLHSLTHSLSASITTEWEWVSEWASEWMSEWLGERVCEWVSALVLCACVRSPTLTQHQHTCARTLFTLELHNPADDDDDTDTDDDDSTVHSITV